jgi:hypothetical protein
MMSQYFDLYGSKNLTMNELRNAVEDALSLRFDVHESSYKGGEYFRAVLRDGEELIIQLNGFQLSDETEITEPAYSEYGVIFWVAWTSRADEFRGELAEIGDLEFLRRRER